MYMFLELNSEWGGETKSREEEKKDEKINKGEEKKIFVCGYGWWV